MPLTLQPLWDNTNHCWLKLAIDDKGDFQVARASVSPKIPANYVSDWQEDKPEAKGDLQHFTVWDHTQKQYAQYCWDKSKKELYRKVPSTPIIIEHYNKTNSQWEAWVEPRTPTSVPVAGRYFPNSFPTELNRPPLHPLYHHTPLFGWGAHKGALKKLTIEFKSTESVSHTGAQPPNPSSLVGYLIAAINVFSSTEEYMHILDQLNHAHLLTEQDQHSILALNFDPSIKQGLIQFFRSAPKTPRDIPLAWTHYLRHIDPTYTTAEEATKLFVRAINLPGYQEFTKLETEQLSKLLAKLIEGPPPSSWALFITNSIRGLTIWTQNSSSANATSTQQWVLDKRISELALQIENRRKGFSQLEHAIATDANLEDLRVLYQIKTPQEAECISTQFISPASLDLTVCFGSAANGTFSSLIDGFLSSYTGSLSNLDQIFASISATKPENSTSAKENKLEPNSQLALLIEQLSNTKLEAFLKRLLALQSAPSIAAVTKTRTLILDYIKRRFESYKKAHEYASAIAEALLPISAIRLDEPLKPEWQQKINSAIEILQGAQLGPPTASEILEALHKIQKASTPKPISYRAAILPRQLKKLQDLKAALLPPQADSLILRPRFIQEAIHTFNLVIQSLATIINPPEREQLLRLQLDVHGVAASTDTDRFKENITALESILQKFQLAIPDDSKREAYASTSKQIAGLLACQLAFIHLTHKQEKLLFEAFKHTFETILASSNPEVSNVLDILEIGLAQLEPVLKNLQQVQQLRDKAANTQADKIEVQPILGVSSYLRTAFRDFLTARTSSDEKSHAKPNSEHLDKIRVLVLIAQLKNNLSDLTGFFQRKSKLELHNYQDYFKNTPLMAQVYNGLKNDLHPSVTQTQFISALKEHHKLAILLSKNQVMLNAKTDYTDDYLTEVLAAHHLMEAPWTTALLGGADAAMDAKPADYLPVETSSALYLQPVPIGAIIGANTASKADKHNFFLINMFYLAYQYHAKEKLPERCRIAIPVQVRHGHWILLAAELTIPSKVAWDNFRKSIRNISSLETTKSYLNSTILIAQIKALYQNVHFTVVESTDGINVDHNVRAQLRPFIQQAFTGKVTVEQARPFSQTDGQHGAGHDCGPLVAEHAHRFLTGRSYFGDDVVSRASSPEAKRSTLSEPTPQERFRALQRLRHEQYEKIAVFRKDKIASLVSSPATHTAPTSASSSSAPFAAAPLTTPLITRPTHSSHRRHGRHTTRPDDRIRSSSRNITASLSSHNPPLSAAPTPSTASQITTSTSSTVTSSTSNLPVTNPVAESSGTPPISSSASAATIAPSSIPAADNASITAAPLPVSLAPDSTETVTAPNTPPIAEPLPRLETHNIINTDSSAGAPLPPPLSPHSSRRHSITSTTAPTDIPPVAEMSAPTSTPKKVGNFQDSRPRRRSLDDLAIHKALKDLARSENHPDIGPPSANGYKLGPVEISGNLIKSNSSDHDDLALMVQAALEAGWTSVDITAANEYARAELVKLCGKMGLKVLSSEVRKDKDEESSKSNKSSAPKSAYNTAHAEPEKTDASTTDTRKTTEEKEPTMPRMPR